MTKIHKIVVVQQLMCTIRCAEAFCIFNYSNLATELSLLCNNSNSNRLHYRPCPSVCLSCIIPAPNSVTKRYSTTKIGANVPQGRFTNLVVKSGIREA